MSDDIGLVAGTLAGYTHLAYAVRLLYMFLRKLLPLERCTISLQVYSEVIRSLQAERMNRRWWFCSLPGMGCSICLSAFCLCYRFVEVNLLVVTFTACHFLARLHCMWSPPGSISTSHLRFHLSLYAFCLTLYLAIRFIICLL